MANHLTEALEIVQQARAQVKEKLTGTKHISNLLTLNGWFDKIEAKLIFIGATKPINLMTSPKTETRFPTMKSMMGRPITYRGKVALEDPAKGVSKTPKEQQNDAFVAAVDKLWGDILKLSPASVINTYRPDGPHVWVLRGVAKRAKVPGFDKADITIKFVQDIQNAIRKYLDDEGRQKIIDKSTGKTATPKPPKNKTVVDKSGPLKETISEEDETPDDTEN